MHTLKGKPHDMTLCMVEYYQEEVDDQIPYGSTNKSFYSSINCVDRDITEMNTFGGKVFFYF